MRQWFLVLAMFAAVGCAQKRVTVQPVPEMPSAPTPEFLANFAPTLPETAFETDGWAFWQFVGPVKIDQPVPGMVMDDHVVRTTLCSPLGPCRLRMYALTMQRDLVAATSTGAMRYLLVSEFGDRVEGYGQWSNADGVYAYYRYRNGVWSLLRDDDAVAEHTFVLASSAYVISLKPMP